MNVPQPFQYQGSKRSLAPAFMRYLPARMSRFVEPFAGSAALSIACAAKGRSAAYWINDVNEPLMKLMDLIIHHPKMIAESYDKTWREQEQDSVEHFYHIRDKFNESTAPELLLYLLARCVKGSIRYNSEGRFNQSPDKRRRGVKPETMKRNIYAISELLRGKAQLTALDYREVLSRVTRDDVVYMDPPYQGVCSERDPRYRDKVSFTEFVEALDRLNRSGVRFAVSYDGRSGEKIYGEPMPSDLNLVLIEIEAGRSSQATLLGRNWATVESLYLSSPLAKELRVTPHVATRKRVEPMALFAEVFV